MAEEPRGPSPRLRLSLIAGAIVILVAGALTAGVLLARPTDREAGQPTSGTSVGPRPTPAPAVTAPGATVPPTASLAGLPLWPFADEAGVVAWQRDFHSEGHQPWHLNADLTALSFTRSYLGYTNVDQVLAAVVSGRSARVTVGFDNPNGDPVTSAVLHLVRFGGGADVPWEVVGTRDTTLTLTSPAYGSTVRSPVTAGGLITGVDESLRVQVHSLSRSTPVGAVDGVPAGGDRAPWQVAVPVTMPSGHGVLTVAVATGGQSTDIERFAITGVRY
ncbi:MAG TPA: hypothetical protein VFW65_32355 [Pseudonocardiaceae bacterium]|nr:hypothetical protein [Pseudonocardiaceae bacterium]